MNEYVLWGIAKGEYLEDLLLETYSYDECLRAQERAKKLGYKTRIATFNFSKPTDIMNDFIKSINI
jgi:hypothetical protein